MTAAAPGLSSPPRGSAGPAPLCRDAAQVRALGLAVEQWGTELGSGSRRPELPWRSTRDPWSVLVSEVMAQQTQVARVVPAYQRFLVAFPTPAACAAAPLAAILRAWAGLGYNRRAQHLHRAAIVVVDRHGGQVPGTLDALLGLPGVGPYTARAVLAFAFGADVGVVDTNAGRVLSRAVAGRSVTTAEAQRLVDAMVPDGRGWSFGQALLDLGAVGLRGRRATLPALPGPPSMPVVGHRAPRPRPGPRLGGSVDGPERVRRIRSPGSRSAGGGVAARGPVPGPDPVGHGMAR